MRPSSKSAAAPPASLRSPKPGATKRQRKAAALGDATNLLVVDETPTPTPSKLRRNARQALPAPSDASRVSSTCSSSASSASVTPARKPSSAAWVTPAPKPSSAAWVTPAPKPSSAASVTPKLSSAALVTPARKPSSAAVLDEERGVLKSPAVSTVYRRTTEAQGRWRRNPAAANSKGKEPVAATASCRPPHGKPSSAVCVTPAPKPSSAAVREEERSVLKSPAIATVYRRTTEAQGRWRRNPTAANSKGKEPVAATASCSPPHGKSARSQSRKKDTRPISASVPCYEGKKKRSISSTPNLLEGLLEKQRAYFADIDAFELVEEVVSESELE